MSIRARAGLRHIWPIIGAVLLAAILGVHAITAAFTRIGFSWPEAMLALTASLLGSVINLPLFTMQTAVPVMEEVNVWRWPFVYRLPVVREERYTMVVAINIGGALIPLLVSFFLLFKYPEVILLSLLSGLIVLTSVYWLARPVRGVGVEIFGFWPPLITAVAVWLLSIPLDASSELRCVAAYCAGTVGTVIGADLLNLRKMTGLGTGLASIGGAGTFDGVFLAGVVAVIFM